MAAPRPTPINDAAAPAPALISPDRTGAVARAVSGVVRVTDDVLVRATGRRPLASALIDRTLWGPLQRGEPVIRPARPLLGLSFDCDYQEDTDALPLLGEVLAEVGVTASICAIGKLVERDPNPYGALVAAGHELVNHTHTHPDNPVLNPDREFWDLSEAEMAEEIGTAQDAFERQVGIRPTGFRSPHFKDAHRMLAAIERFEEMAYLSTVLQGKTPSGLPYRPARDAAVLSDRSHFVSSPDPAGNSRLVQLPLTPCPDHRWSPLCSYHTIRRPRLDATGQGMHPAEQFPQLWERMLDRAASDRYALVYFDPKDVAGSAEAASVFGEMLRIAVAAGWQVTTMAAVADLWPLP
ncbi:polysaccharide deacetylase family protein [Euzebya tangerina]|uniref:polysaccharide deacetylase family protein n=1 Tax=Euzebya tangerina TaxID=591198 RepID=UPI00196B48AC|nr:polysaccharide deacetylase family protein [Euzebya tangerina]